MGRLILAKTPCISPICFSRLFRPNSYNALMTDKAKNSTLELLWAVHADIAAVKDKVTEVLAQLRIRGTQISGLV